MNKDALYCEFLVFCGERMDNISFPRLQEFAQFQFPIVYRALVEGEGVRACDSRAHDMTCSFVEQKLFNC